MALKIGIIFGTRPEAIKLAPLIHKFKESKINTTIINTGQHKELLDPVLQFFSINPDYNLKSMNPDLVQNTSKMSLLLNDVIKKEKPDCVIVQGDTLSCYIGSYVTFLNKIPVMHVEAGLRSYDKFSPFPEEMFRQLTDRLSDVAFAPTKKARENLLKEGFSEDRILLTGNTIVDAVLLGLKLLNREQIEKELQNKAGIPLKDFNEIIFITTHRRENIGKPLENIRDAILELASKYRDVLFIWSLHKNPAVRKSILNEKLLKRENILIIEHLSYPQALYLMQKARLIITDSGGIQEEACVLKKPVLIVRETSERPEVIEVGLGVLAGTERENIIKIFERLWSQKHEIEKRDIKNPYGDGKASERIKDFLLCEKVKDFILNYKNNYRENLNECSKKYSTFDFTY